jgi:hypothetical protein
VGQPVGVHEVIAIFAGELTKTPTYFVRPVYYGGPVDGLVGWLVEPDRLGERQEYAGGSYQFRGFRMSCPTRADAVYEWEVAT